MRPCQVSSGVLFDHPCPEPAAATCSTCHRPMCRLHERKAPGMGSVCVACLRARLRDQGQRPHFAHLRDDPYFYWYFDGSDWLEAYDAADYAVFDHSEPAGDDAMLPAGGAWEGS